MRILGVENGVGSGARARLFGHGGQGVDMVRRIGGGGPAALGACHGWKSRQM